MLDMNETAKARSYLSFHLNFALLMINCGRNEEAERSLRLLASGIQELPEDLSININEEKDR
jgi:hypothetical protein